MTERRALPRNALDAGLTLTTILSRPAIASDVLVELLSIKANPCALNTIITRGT